MHYYLELPRAEIAHVLELHPRKVSYLWIAATEKLDWIPVSERPRQRTAPECRCQGAVRPLHETDSDRLGEPSVHPVPESETLLELLAQWEELRQQGKRQNARFVLFFCRLSGLPRRVD